MTVCQENLHHTQEFQKQVYNNGVKPRSYDFRGKVWLNNKYITLKQNQKLEAKFLRPFWLLNPVGKEVYKLKLPKRWRIYNVFHISLLEQNIARKEQVDKKVMELEFKISNSNKYKVKEIWESAIYANKAKDYLLGLYYLVV